MKQASNDESMRPSGTIQSAARACRILLFLAGRPEGARAKEVALAQAVPLPTAHHLLATLVTEGLVRKDLTRNYHLGPKIGVLSEAFGRQATVPDTFMTGLRRLAGITGETAYLSGWHLDEIRVFAVVEGSQAVRVAGLGRGYSSDAHARASGKLLLALATPEVRSAYLESHSLVERTPHTITDRKDLEAEFARIRDCGYSVDQEEFVEGVACVSAPICESGVPVVAVTISAPLERFLRSRTELTEAVVDVARSLIADSTRRMQEK